MSNAAKKFPEQNKTILKEVKAPEGGHGGRPKLAFLTTAVDSAKSAWKELRARFGIWALMPFALLLVLAAVFGFLAAVPALAPFVYPLF